MLWQRRVQIGFSSVAPSSVMMIWWSIRIDWSTHVLLYALLREYMTKCDRSTCYLQAVLGVSCFVRHQLPLETGICFTLSFIFQQMFAKVERFLLQGAALETRLRGWISFDFATVRMSARSSWYKMVLVEYKYFTASGRYLKKSLPGDQSVLSWAFHIFQRYFLLAEVDSVCKQQLTLLSGSVTMSLVQYQS